VPGVDIVAGNVPADAASSQIAAMPIQSRPRAARLNVGRSSAGFVGHLLVTERPHGLRGAQGCVCVREVALDLWSHAGEWAGKSNNTAHEATHEDDHESPSFLIATVMWFTVLMPYVGLAALVAWTWLAALSWFDLACLVVCYLAIGFGVTVGYHRLLAHRAFTTWRWLEVVLLILGCMAMQGPPVRWAATHRRHHQRSDHEGDPHSPHHHGSGVTGFVKGLWHAHTGWLLCKDATDTARSCTDMLTSPAVRFVDRYYAVWLALSVLVPFSLGAIVKGSLVGGLVTLLWATVLRIALMHHATWSVNSICHLFGYRSYQSGDGSRNNPVVAMLSLGEGWHNNHHAFPTSARHGLRWFEFDASYVLIRSLQLLGLAWDVRLPSAAARRAKAAVNVPVAAAAS
jgi:stearoyl-CoA desaturase (delta-9 desaturase)